MCYTLPRSGKIKAGGTERKGTMKDYEAARLGKKFNRMCGPVKTIKVDPDTKEEIVVKVEKGKSFWREMKDQGKDPMRYKGFGKSGPPRIHKARPKGRALNKEEKRIRSEREVEAYNRYLKLPGDGVKISYKRFRRVYRAGILGSDKRITKD